MLADGCLVVERVGEDEERGEDGMDAREGQRTRETGGFAALSQSAVEDSNRQVMEVARRESLSN